MIELPLSRANGINDAGWIVGVMDGAAAVLSPDGQVTVLTRGGGPVEGVAFDINQSGVIVGRTRSTGGHWEATRWTPHDGLYFGQSLETVPAVESQATALNDAGEIVGSITRAVDRKGGTQREAWRWHDGPIGETLGTLLGGDDAVATAINNGGFLERRSFVVGYGNTEPGGRSHAIIRLPGSAKFTEVDLPGQWSVANDVSPHGRLAGWYTNEPAVESCTYDGDYRGIVPLTAKPYTMVGGKVIVLPHMVIFPTDGGGGAAVNACGTIVGHVASDFVVNAVRWMKPLCDP